MKSTKNYIKVLIRTILMFVFLALSICRPTYSQPTQFRFQHFTSENGLPQNTVYDICQDKYGFMWFSTKNGICKYDGYTTKIFKPSAIMPTDVVDLAQCIKTDDEGNILFGTGYGFYVLDTEKDSITRFINFDSIDSMDTYLNNVFSIFPDGDNVWVGTGNGLVLYNRNSGQLKRFSGIELIPDFKSSRCWVKSITGDHKGTIWLTTQDALVNLNTTNYKATIFSSTQPKPNFIFNKYFSSLVLDKDGKLWIGTLRKGVYSLDIKTLALDSINFIGLSDTSEAFNEIKKLYADSHGFIWAATQYSGLVRINTRTKRIQKIRSSQVSNYSLSSDLTSALYEDKAGILWVGTYNNGVDRTIASGSSFMNIPFASSDSTCFSIKAVECFAEQDSANVWVGTMKGLFLFNRTTHSCKSFEEATKNKIALPHPSIAGLEFDSDGKLWIGTRSDIMVRVNLIDNTFNYFRPDTSKPFLNKINDFRTLVKTPEGEIYYSYDTRLMRFDSITNSLIVVVDKDSMLLKTSRINRLSADRSGNIFIGSDFSGLMKYNIPSNTISQIQSPDINKDRFSQNVLVNQLKDGSYVLTDYNGLYLFDKNFVFQKHYTDKDGLTDNKINNLSVDKSGKIWMATFNGLTSFDPSNLQFRKYYVQDGLAENEFRESKALQSKDGTIFFPSGKGFTFFNPNDIKPYSGSLDIYFTGFKVFDKEKWFGRNLNDLSEISVPAGFNFFTISFASTAFNTVTNRSFQYKLEGVDNAWIDSKGANYANYTNLDGGDYIFKIRIPDFNEEKQLTIHVGTIYYKTWWFRGILFLLLCALIFSFIKFREKQIEKSDYNKTIDYFANSYYGKNSVDEVLWDVCRNCISRLGFEDAVVYLVDEKRKVLIQKAAYGPKNPKDFEIVHPLEIPIGVGVVGNVAKSGSPILINDTTKDPRYIADDDKRLSELAVPLVYQDKVIGVIDSENSKRHFFTQDHLRILTTISSICSTKIANAINKQEASDRERLLLEVGKKVAETRLMALRAQMNPHFIFNSLNSIQDCIVREKIDDAQLYLSRFSKLLRLVIDYSEQPLISLEKEIQFLELYLSLESLRFGDSFIYSIKISDQLDAEDTRIPSLLIQPFVENAIWHGLLHKDNDRKLEISFDIKDENHLVCVVKDNGVGRAKASEIKAGKLGVSDHESKGMKISEERMELVKIQSGFNPGIVVEDLTDSNGMACGTKVSIILPLSM